MQICFQIVYVLESHRYPYEVIGDARLCSLDITQAAMGSCGRVNDSGFGIPEICSE